MAGAHPLDHDLLTPPEVLDYLRITTRTLYRLIKAGTVPAVRVGHQWRVRRTDLEEWLRQSPPVPVFPTQPPARMAGSGRLQASVPPVDDGNSQMGERR
jgi:excisionase family DNA binding protein